MNPTGNAPVPTGSGSGVSPDRKLENEDLLRLHNIQSDLLISHRKKNEAHIYFTITDKNALGTFIASLPITSAADTFRPDSEQTKIALLTGLPAPKVRLGVGFSFRGLEVVQTNMEGTADREAFKQGMHRRAVAELNDPDPAGWEFGNDDSIDGVFIITAESVSDLTNALKGPFLKPSGYQVVGKPVLSNARPGEADGLEHFGFRDGISQPGIRGCVDAAKTIPLTRNSDMDEPDKGLPGQDLLWPGEFVLGYHAQKDGAKTFPEKGEIAPVPDWMKDGAFMVIRKLQQFVPEMHAGVAAAAKPAGQRPEQLEAQLVGRWPGGASVITHPNADDAVLGKDEQRNNDFEFGGDRRGLICPWAAHIRKTYPRDDVRGKVGPDPGQSAEDFEKEVKEEEARTHRRRLLRRGLQYGPEVTKQEDSQGKTTEDRGLMFKCYVTSLTRQFEFVQKFWVNNPGFVQDASGHDAIIGQTPGGGDRTFAGVGDIGHKPDFTFKPWVKMTGGGYFFAPSIEFLDNLAPKTA